MAKKTTAKSASKETAKPDPDAPEGQTPDKAKSESNANLNGKLDDDGRSDGAFPPTVEQSNPTDLYPTTEQIPDSERPRIDPDAIPRVIDDEHYLEPKVINNDEPHEQIRLMNDNKPGVDDILIEEGTKAIEAAMSDKDVVLYESRSQEPTMFPVAGVYPIRDFSTGKLIWQVPKADADRFKKHHHVVIGRIQKKA